MALAGNKSYMKIASQIPINYIGCTGNELELHRKPANASADVGYVDVACTSADVGYVDVACTCIGPHHPVHDILC